MKRQLTFCCLLFVALSDAKSNSNFVYNGNDKIWLALDEAFKLDLLENGQIMDTFSLLPASDATVEGVSNGSDSVMLNIHYGKAISGSSGGSLNDVKLSFEVTTRSNGYWYLTALKLSYGGSYGDAKKTVNVANQPLDVDSRPGVTKNPADNICERGFLTCAPKNLCWACDDQVLKAKQSNSEGVNARLTMPGLKLQPVTKSSPGVVKFGYEWNCDPLIPLGVWVGILLTLVLVTFLYWAIDMLVNLQTPKRFDDPRGKPLNVPTSE